MASRDLNFNILFEASTAKAERSIASFTRAFPRRIKAAVDSLPDINLDANSTAADRRIAEIRRELQALGGKRIGIDIDAGKAQAQMRSLSDELEKLGSKSRSVQVRADTAAATAALGAVTGQVDRLDGRTAKVNVKVDGAAQGIVGVAALGRAMGQLALPAAVVAATPALVSLGSSAVQAAGGVALLPAVLGSAGLAAGTLMVGLDGVGDTLEAFGKEQEAAGVKALKASEGMTTGAAKAEYAYRQLSDSGRGLVDSLRAQGPAWADLKLDVQEQLLRGVGSQVSALGDRYLPVLRTALVDTGTSFNAAFAMSANFMALPSTVTDISVATGRVTEGLDNASRAAKPLLAAFTDLYVVGSEFMPALGQSATDVAERFAAFIEEARKTGQLKGWIQDSIDVLNQLGRIGGNVGGILGSTLDAVDRSGQSFLTTLEQMTGKLDAALNTPKGGAALQEFFTTTRELTRSFIDHLVQLWPAIQAAAGAFAALLTAGSPLATVITDLVVSGLVPLLKTIEVLSPLLGPIAVQMLAMSLAAKALSGAAALTSGAFAAFAPASVMSRMAGFRTGMDTAGLSAGVLTERLTGSAGAGEKVAAAGSKVGMAATRVASTLPVAGLAVIGFTTAVQALSISTDDAATAMMAGGAAADQASLQIQRQSGVIGENKGWVDAVDRSVNDWIGSTTGLWATQETTNQKIREQTAAMSPLQAAQQAVTYATNEHTQAVARFGVDSPQAAVAAGALTAATVALEIQQRAAADGTDTHTAAIRRQQDLLFAAIETEIRYRDAIAGVTAAVAANGVGTDLNTEAGRRNTEALNRAIEAAAAHTDGLHKQGAAQGVVEMTARAQRAALYDAAVQTGMSREEARKYVDQLYAIPGSRNTTVHADTGPARRAIDEFLRSARAEEIVIKARADTGNIMGGATPRRAAGGPIFGPGTGTSDSILARVSDGEHVWTAREVRGAGGHGQVGRLRGMAGSGTLPSFAAGGMVRAEDGSMVPASFYDKPVTAPSQARLDYLAGQRGGAQAGAQSGGGSQIPTDPRSANDLSDAIQDLIKRALTPLNRALNDDTIPSLVLTGEHHAQLALDVLTATTGMQGSTDMLREFSNAAWTDMQEQTGLNVGMTLGTHFLALTTGHRDTELSTQALQLLSNTSWLDMQARTGAEIGVIAGPHFGFLAQGHRNTEASQTALQNLSNASWGNITATTGANVGQITGPIFTGLHAGMTGVEQHGVTMADGWRIQLDRLRAAAADPIRWIMQFPLGPPGIAASWNTLDDQFKLGKRVNPPAPGFAKGGIVPGWSPGRDDHLTPTSGGEAVMRPEWTRAKGPGYVEGANAAARTGGSASVQRFERDHFRALQSGKLVEGADHDGGGYSTSGFGGVKPHVAQAGHMLKQRFGIGTVGGVGSRPGPSDHPAGLALDFMTYQDMGKGDRLADYAVQNSAHLAMKYIIWRQRINEGGGWKGMANRGSATANHMDHPHVSFLPGPGGGKGFAGGGDGGPGFDPGPVVEGAFKRAYELVNDVTRFFGDSNYATGGQGVARQTVDAVKAKALEAVAATAGGGGALGPLGSGAPFYVGEISRNAKGHGFGVDGATIGVATSLVETNLRNLANRAVPESLNHPNDGLGGDHDSIGLFQQRQAGWGTTAQRMNPFAAAGMFFDKLGTFNWRGMDPGAAAQKVQVSAFPGRYSGKMGQARSLVGQHGGAFDLGGDFPPGTWGVNQSGQTEHVLRGPERAAFLELVDGIRRPQVRGPAGGGGDTFIVQTTAQATAPQIIGEAVHAAKVRRHQGKYRR